MLSLCILPSTAPTTYPPYHLIITIFFIFYIYIVNISMAGIGGFKGGVAWKSAAKCIFFWKRHIILTEGGMASWHCIGLIPWNSIKSVCSFGLLQVGFFWIIGVYTAGFIQNWISVKGRDTEYMTQLLYCINVCFLGGIHH